ncbi:hypothetical protein M4951_14685 [Blastopirellula sp. J2-11]|uniref:hypothetical protein n=1 Tax=Blastopirellula sp. J2-11 TaxID=2943192 RepID=UPI0021C90D3B|nr:hypothetical protein [Blastopirellula sp. J2-11]UUO04637.1 hypothetical protein M4951_14685 [Blastopirellula sp. J2-11]
MNETLSHDKDASSKRRREILFALRNASREAYCLDDELRQLCIDQVRDTLKSNEANIRERLSAAAFVLKLNEFNLERILLMAEIHAILDENDVNDDAMDIVTNKNFFGNDAHETAECANQKSSDEACEKATDRCAATASAPTADPA